MNAVIAQMVDNLDVNATSVVDLPGSAFRQMFDGSSAALLVIDQRANICLANPRAERVFGYEAGAMRGVRVGAIMHESARSFGLRQLIKCSAQSHSRELGPLYRAFGVKRDGHQFPVEFGVSRITLAGGRYFVVSLRAFSQERGARYDALVASMGALVANIGRLALEAPDQNASFQRIAELVAAELEIDAVAIVFRHRSSGAIQMPAAVGLTPSLSKLVPKLWLMEFSAIGGANNVALSLTFGSLCDAPTTPLRKHLVDAGYADLIAMPMFDRGQVIGGLFAFARKTYSFDRDKIVFLQAVVNLLTSAVQRSRAEEQLAHARRLDAVGQLTGGVAHDFNNLLTVISGNLQLLQNELRDEPRAASVLAGALRAVGRGSDLTRKLLAFGRRQRLNPQTLNPFKQITELKPALAATLGGKVEVLVESATNLPNVFVDPAEFEATLINLALNARDAMPEGGVLQINIRSHRVSLTDSFGELRPGQYVLISVRDSGLGMPPEVLAHALEPFFTTKEAGRGNGLGLSMVYGFVKQSGGHLAISSTPGSGTRLDIYLPAVKAAIAGQACLNMADPSGGSETIIVVEDEAEVRKIAVMFLESLGYSTFEAADAQEALHLLRSIPNISLLFTDVILGHGMNGGELYAEAKRLHPNLPVLLTSGYERPLSQAGTAVPKSVPLLRKPYRREQLAAAVRGSIDGAATA